MPTPHDQTPLPTLDPDSLYTFCLAKIQAQQHLRPAFPSLDTDTLLWSLTVSFAHALETAARVFGTLCPSEPRQVVRLTALLMMAQTPAALYDLWRVWCKPHTDWVDADTLQVPVYFLSCRAHSSNSLRELSRRGRLLNLPVFKAWAGLEAGPAQPDGVRLRRLTDAMDATIWTTVGRHLDRTRDEGRETDPSAITDKQNVAIEGAVAKKRRIQARVVELLRREEAIPTDSGLSIEVPTIPKLPIRGMEGTDGLNSLWRSAAKDEAFELLASIAPGHLGLLETTLPDAAHAAQRAENDRAAAKKRGGSGGRKAKKAGTAEHAAQHLPIGEVDEDSACIDPETLIDDRPNPEEKAEAQEVAEHAIRIAIDRWGPSGQRMLEALTAGKTDKEAAEAAGISAPAMTKRLKTLQKMLDC